MERLQLSPDEVVRRGTDWYQSRIRSIVEPGNDGKYLIINVETGEYILGSDDVVASREAKAAFPNAPLFSMRVGRPAAYRLGGKFGETAA